ncbi:hypothetical protein RBU60_03280 [Mesonia sp. MT50]|uniref:Uncharacterized protein n=1 Tax=Mesonia profundi TaxID=3070998 RepID=A0ABU0ZZ35_9FLAO|nr:hypothetical protein [Mesonia profundi]MDQ7916585.1 hypothetical protein [Mesonia profundi]
MKTLKKISYLILFICIGLMIGCGSDDDKSNPNDDPGNPSSQQGEPHSYDIIINEENADERHISGEIENVFGSNNTGSDFSTYSTIENGKLMVLHLSNSDVVINGMFYYANDGHTTDLGLNTDNQSNMIITFSPPSSDIHQSVSGSVELNNIHYGLVEAEGGIVGYTLTFDGNFQEVNDNTSQISGTFVINLPSLL